MTERMKKILYGIKGIKPKTSAEQAVKFALDNAGGGGGSSLPDVTAADNGKLLGVSGGAWDKVEKDIVRVPFTLTVTDEGLSATTDANFADTFEARANGKVIIAAATLDFGNGIIQYLDGIMGSGKAAGDSILESTITSLSGSGTKLEVYDIKWTANGVTPTKKEAPVS